MSRGLVAFAGAGAGSLSQAFAAAIGAGWAPFMALDPAVHRPEAHCLAIDAEAMRPDQAVELRALAVSLVFIGSGSTVADDALRAELLANELPHVVVSGAPAARLEQAVAAWQAHKRWLALQGRDDSQAMSNTASRAWRHLCGRCGDADCERHLFELTRRTEGPP